MAGWKIRKDKIVASFERDAAIFRELAASYREEALLMDLLNQAEEAMMRELEKPDAGSRARGLSILRELRERFISTEPGQQGEISDESKEFLQGLDDLQAIWEQVWET